MTLPRTFFYRLRRRRYRRKNVRSRLGKIAIWSSRIFILLLIIDIAYLYAIWPDWKQFSLGNHTKSRFIKVYEQRRAQDSKLPKLRWTPIPHSWIPRHVRRAVIVAEDARFYSHMGVDPIALQDAMQYNLENMEVKYGASTLSQQTIKNMYFTPSRNPLRKWHELVLTLAMEYRVSKKRIITTYLNIAEFGKGIYGVEAAAQAYWNTSTAALTPWQAAQLAASLPSPVKHNPATRTKTFLRRAKRIYKRL
jgi:monofunctional biosynthetic peptidoglycan transglycosylase